MTDAVVMGHKAQATHHEVADMAALTSDEKDLEKKLVRRIDSLIMPLVILVYLLNYIDR